MKKSYTFPNVPSKPELFNEISEFALSNQMNSTKKEIEEFLEELTKIYPFINHVNFNSRKNNGTGSGGSMNAYYSISINLDNRILNVNFKKVLCGHFNEFYNKEMPISNRFRMIDGFSAYADNKLKEAIKTLAYYKVITPIEENYIHVFNYIGDNAYNSFNKSYVEKKAARKTKLTGDGNHIGEKVIIRDSTTDRIILAKIDAPLEEWDNTGEYPVVYAVKFITDIIKLSPDDNKRCFIQRYSPSENSQNSLLEYWNNIISGMKTIEINAQPNSSEISKIKELRHIFEEKNIPYFVKEDKYGHTYIIFSQKNYDKCVLSIKRTGKMKLGAFSKIPHSNPVFKNNVGYFTLPKTTKDMVEIKKLIDIFINNL